MKSCVFFVLCILALVSPRDAVADHKTPRSESAISSLTRIQETPPSRSTTPKSSEKVPTSYRSQKTPPVPKSSTKVPTGYPTRASPKTPVKTIGTTSRQKPESPIHQSSYSTSTTTTTAKSTTNSSAPKTLTVSDGHTASAQVGWMVVGSGIGGSVVVGGNVLPVAGGTEGIIVENSSGQDEIDPTTPTTSPTSSPTSSSSSSSSSPTASPTPYNIYPKKDSTPSQKSAFTRNLVQIAKPGSVRSITGRQDRLLLWVASLTPAQASELSRNPVVSPLPGDIYFRSCCNLDVLTRSGALMWICPYKLIWKEGVQVALLRHQIVLLRTVRIKSVMKLF